MKHRILSLLLTLSLLFTLAVPAFAYTAEEQYDLLLAVQQHLREEGLESSVDDEPLARALIRALEQEPALFEWLMAEMLSGYDPHTRYMPAGSYSAAYDPENDYVGIGVTIQAHPLGALITDVNLSGPAFSAGLRMQDVLVEANGQPLKGMSVSDISDLLRGVENTQVTVKVLRASQELTVTLTRKALTELFYSGTHIADGAYYMKWSRISGKDNYWLFRLGLRQMRRLGDTCLILDLRDNPGGSLDMGLSIANDLIPNAVPFFELVTRDPDGSKRPVTTRLTADGDGEEIPHIFILMNENSASAAEIIAAALHDAAGAVTIGATTYGKARAQQHIQLDNDSAIVLTTIGLRSLQAGDYEGVGLTPDIPVSNAIIRSEDAIRVPETALLAPYSCSDNGEALNRALVALGELDALPEKPYQVGPETMAACRRLEALYRTPGPVDAPIGIETLQLINHLLDLQGQGTYVQDLQLAKALSLAAEAQK